MTDNEIIEALERCKYHKECCFCNSVEECGNKKKLTTSALDLITRIREENEALINGQETLQKYIAKKDAEIERLKGWQDLLKAEKHSLIKTEAIKEFAERLHKKIDEYRDKREMPMLPYTGYALDYVDRNIDNLVKEMVGEDKVQWSKQGECPMTPEQFNAIYDDEEMVGDV